jgi:hypothetical protein
MYKVVGLNEKEVMNAESFTESLRFLHEHCSEAIALGGTPRNSETTCFIEAKGETATTRMCYPYIFEFAIKVGLIKNGKLVEPLIEPPIVELIAAFSRAAVLQMMTGMGCH